MLPTLSALVANGANFESAVLEAIKQVPALVVLAFLTWRFLVVWGDRDKRSQEAETERQKTFAGIATECHEFQQNLLERTEAAMGKVAESIDRNTEVMGRAASAIERSERRENERSSTLLRQPAKTSAGRMA